LIKWIFYAVNIFSENYNISIRFEARLVMDYGALDQQWTNVGRAEDWAAESPPSFEILISPQLNSKWDPGGWTITHSNAKYFCQTGHRWEVGLQPYFFYYHPKYWYIFGLKLFESCVGMHDQPCYSGSDAAGDPQQAPRNYDVETEIKERTQSTPRISSRRFKA